MSTRFRLISILTFTLCAMLAVPGCGATQSEQITEPTISAPLPQSPQLVLPSPFTLEQFSGGESIRTILARNAVRRGKPLELLGRTEPLTIKANNGVTLTSEMLADASWRVQVSAPGKSIFELVVPNIGGPSGLLQFSTYQAHWLVEVVSGHPSESTVETDIIEDGISLSKSRGYREAFGLQLLHGKPFFFYRDVDGIGISYDGTDTRLPYNDVLDKLWCWDCEPSFIQFENSVIFFASLGRNQYIVELGVYDQR